MALTQKQKEQFNKAMAWRLGVDVEVWNTFLAMTEEEKLNTIKEWKEFKQTQITNLTEKLTSTQSDII